MQAAQDRLRLSTSQPHNTSRIAGDSTHTRLPQEAVQDFARLLVLPMSLPNFAFTWPLAQHLRPNRSTPKQQSDGKGLLADAVCFFPAAITQLTARCCTEHGLRVSTKGIYASPGALSQSCRMY